MTNNFITALDGNFIVNEKPMRFIGCNMYELAYVDTETTSLMIREAAAEGFSVIRFWAFEPIKKEKLFEICSLAKMLNIKIIPVLADTHGYLQNYKIDPDWYKEGFKKNYLKFIEDVSCSFKDQDEILLWELINEPQTDSIDDIYNFCKISSELIKTSDPNHLVSVGTIGGIGDQFGNFFSRFDRENFKKIFSIKTLDAASIHDYSFNSTLLERLDIYQRLKGNSNSSGLLNSLNKILNAVPDAIDKFTLNKYGKSFDFYLTLRRIWKHFNSENIAVAKELKKPLYAGEVGFKRNLGELRKKILEIELNNYFRSGVSGVLLWSFESQGRSLDGHDYGFSADDGFGNIVKNSGFNNRLHS